MVDLNRHTIYWLIAAVCESRSHTSVWNVCPEWCRLRVNEGLVSIIRSGVNLGSLRETNVPRSIASSRQRRRLENRQRRSVERHSKLVRRVQLSGGNERRRRGERAGEAADRPSWAAKRRRRAACTRLADRLNEYRYTHARDR